MHAHAGQKFNWYSWVALTSQECDFERMFQNIFQNASALFTQPKVILVTRTKKKAKADILMIITG